MPRFQDPTEITEFRRALQVGHDPHQPYVAICGGTGCLALGAAEVRQAFQEAIQERHQGQSGDEIHRLPWLL